MSASRSDKGQLAALLLGIAVALFAVLAMRLGTGEDPGEIVEYEVGQSPEEIEEYWTPERLAEAEPAPMPVEG